MNTRKNEFFVVVELCEFMAEHLLEPFGEHLSVKFFMNTASKEYFFAGHWQITLFPVYSGNMYDILNSRGIEIYEKVKQHAKSFKAEFSEYILFKENSGAWTPDTTSKYYREQMPLHSFNTWNNYAILGKTNGQWFKTSCCIFISEEDSEKWCFTLNGSFYKLGKRVSIDEMTK